MLIEKTLDNILDTKSKVRIIRLFVSKTEDFMASGREIAKLVGITPPTAHAALKELYNQDILKLEIIGKQHIYRMNYSNRVVKDMLQPMFKKERSIKDDVVTFLRSKISENKIQKLISSLILYGSLQRGETHGKSDCDIAVIVKGGDAKKRIESLFIDTISSEFSKYFGIHLDSYVKTIDEFKEKLKKNDTPVSTLMKSYTVVFGKDPIDYK